MIDKSFLQKVEEMVMEGTTLDVHDMTYTSTKMFPVLPPAPAGLEVSTLTSVIDYCKEFAPFEKWVVQVCSPSVVKVMSLLNPKFKTREQYLVANAYVSPFKYDQFMSVDKFVIALQAQFIQTETTANILKLVGNMTTRNEVGAKDDGVTQVVEARTGLVSVNTVSVPNPVSLAPYRTFAEVDQPHSNFVLRLNTSHECALFEADGGAWRNTAMDLVKQYLLAAFEDANIEHKLIVIA